MGGQSWDFAPENSCAWAWSPGRVGLAMSACQSWRLGARELGCLVHGGPNCAPPPGTLGRRPRCSTLARALHVPAPPSQSTFRTVIPGRCPGPARARRRWVSTRPLPTQNSLLQTRNRAPHAHTMRANSSPTPSRADPLAPSPLPWQTLARPPPPTPLTVGMALCGFRALTTRGRQSRAWTAPACWARPCR